jgi:hypothetical protein
VWTTGAGESAVGASLGSKFGWDGHNYLGYADTWELNAGTSDEELLAPFGAPSSIRDDPEARERLLCYLRANTRPSG